MKSLLIYSDDKLFLKLPTHQAISRSAENNVHPRHSGHSAIPSRMDLFWVSVCSWCPFIRVQPISIQTFLYYNWKTIFFKSKTGNKMQNNCRNPESFPGFPFCTNSPALIFPRKRPGSSRIWYPVFHAAFPDRAGKNGSLQMNRPTGILNFPAVAFSTCLTVMFYSANSTVRLVITV